MASRRKRREPKLTPEQIAAARAELDRAVAELAAMAVPEIALDVPAWMNDPLPDIDFEVPELDPLDLDLDLSRLLDIPPPEDGNR